MANEIQVQCSLNINANDAGGRVSYASQPNGFSATMVGRKGPAPGAFTVTVGGTDADLSMFTTPGMCRIMNQDAANFVTYGIKDNNTNTYYDLGEILPGESYPIRLSRNMLKKYVGTGSGVAASTTLHFKASKASVNVLLEAFEA